MPNVKRAQRGVFTNGDRAAKLATHPQLASAWKSLDVEKNMSANVFFAALAAAGAAAKRRDFLYFFDDVTEELAAAFQPTAKLFLHDSDRESHRQ